MARMAEPWTWESRESAGRARCIDCRPAFAQEQRGVRPLEFGNSCTLGKVARRLTWRLRYRIPEKHRATKIRGSPSWRPFSPWPTRLMMAPHTFGLYAPSGLVSDAAVIERAVARLTALGHRVHIDAGVHERYLRFAGNDSERLAAIERVATDSEVDIALAIRGGYGWTRLLDRFDYAELARSGKRWLGHSDFTAFQLAMLARAGAITFAGPMAAYDFGADSPSEFTRENCFGVLDHASWEIACALDGPSRIACTGTIWGGNLALVAHLVGTVYFPQITGGVLFLEDIAEHPYRIERMLYQLLHAGVLYKQRAILLGAFTDYQPLPNDYGYVFAAAVAHMRSRVLLLIYTGLSFGHVRDKLTLPVGGHCAFDARDGHARLVLSDYGV